MKTLQAMGNQFAPDGLILNRHTASNAFSIKGQSGYAEYYFNADLLQETGSPEGTILAVRRIQKQKMDGRKRNDPLIQKLLENQAIQFGTNPNTQS